MKESSTNATEVLNMRSILTVALGMGLLLLMGAARSLASPPEVGDVIHAGTNGIFCLKDVAAEVYKGSTRASEVKPKLDEQMDSKTCDIVTIPVDGTISKVERVGTILTDFEAHPQTDNVYSLTISFLGQTMWVLWAETAPPSI